jgi:hypothetical protein
MEKKRYIFSVFGFHFSCCVIWKTFYICHLHPDKLKHWKVLSKGGDGFAFEQPPAGSDQVPVEAENDSKLVENACFSTSYHSCSKEQVIDLSALGINSEVIKQCKPKIHIIDW